MLSRIQSKIHRHDLIEIKFEVEISRSLFPRNRFGDKGFNTMINTKY